MMVMKHLKTMMLGSLLLLPLMATAQIQHVQGPPVNNQSSRPQKQKPQKQNSEFNGKTASEIDSIGNLHFTGRNGKGINYTEAVKWFRKAAEMGDASGQWHLGICYSNGFGVTKDESEGVKWYRKSAEQGFVHAQYCMGNAYYHAWGVTKDYVEAVKWYSKAAEQGDAPSQYGLALCYYYGEGVEKNPDEAKSLLHKADSLGYSDAKWKLKSWFGE